MDESWRRRRLWVTGYTLLVIPDDIALVIESKFCFRSVCGGGNGDRQVHLASGL